MFSSELLSVQLINMLFLGSSIPSGIPLTPVDHFLSHFPHYNLIFYLIYFDLFSSDTFTKFVANMQAYPGLV